VHGAFDVTPCAQVRVSLTGTERNARGVIAGPIWISADDSDEAFPEVRWSDFPLVLLASWIPSLRRLASRGQAAECRFMDGPYHFTVTGGAGGDWRIACFERREETGAANAVTEWSTTPKVFLESALAAGRGILGYCDTREWWGAEADRLREVIASADPGAAS
jgi:hypothetical protein